MNQNKVKYIFYIENQENNVIRFLIHNYSKDNEYTILTENHLVDAANCKFAIFKNVNVLPLTSINFTCNEIIIPVTLTTTHLKQITNETIHIQNLNFLYENIKRLWYSGFKKFKITNALGNLTLNFDFLLHNLENSHKNERCFVIGNGPSLNLINMSKLKDEITLGANRSYLGFEKWGFEFKYWGIVDRLQIEEYGQEYERFLPEDIIKFFPFEYLSFLKFKNQCPVNHYYNYEDFPKFSVDCDKIYLGNTVTYFLIQIAAIMGCNPIILIGVDHNYHLNIENKSYNSKWCASDAKRDTHFDDKYTSSEKKFIQPRPEKAEMAFDHANAWSIENNVEILNATPNSALNSFEKVKYEKLF
jgi:hypothetical protein